MELVFPTHMSKNTKATSNRNGFCVFSYSFTALERIRALARRIEASRQRLLSFTRASVRLFYKSFLKGR